MSWPVNPKWPAATIKLFREVEQRVVLPPSKTQEDVLAFDAHMRIRERLIANNRLLEYFQDEIFPRLRRHLKTHYLDDDTAQIESCGFLSYIMVSFWKNRLLPNVDDRYEGKAKDEPMTVFEIEWTENTHQLKLIWQPALGVDCVLGTYPVLADETVMFRAIAARIDAVKDEILPLERTLRKCEGEVKAQSMPKNSASDKRKNFAFVLHRAPIDNVVVTTSIGDTIAIASASNVAIPLTLTVFHLLACLYMIVADGNARTRLDGR